MDTTITIEFFSDTKEHLRMLEQSLKHEHDVDVDLVEPRDAQAPAPVGQVDVQQAVSRHQAPSMPRPEPR